MFFQRTFPRICWRGGWGGPPGCNRWFGHRRFVPIGRPWGRSLAPWNFWRGFPGPFGMMSRMERDFEDMCRRMNEVFGSRPAYPTSRHADSHTPEIRVHFDDKSFELYLNVSEYEPEELTVKVVDDRVMISGKHTERPDTHGSITRQFVRYINIPEDVDPESITCEIGDDGQMTVQGNVKDAVPRSERVVNIERKNPANVEGTPGGEGGSSESR